jgi:hypothetical protein
VSLNLVPVSQGVAKKACADWHRHNKPPLGSLFQVGAATAGGELVAVGIAGRPVARHFDDGNTVEVIRVASSGYPNATSMLYGALRRAAFALGYTRVITYTQADESGSSLRAAGYRVIGERPARKGWDSAARPRDDAGYRSTARTLWESE